MHERVNKSGAEAFSSTDPQSAGTLLKNNSSSTAKLKKQKPFLSKAQNSDNRDSVAAFDGAPSPEHAQEEYIRGKKEGREILARERVLEDKVADLSAKIEELTALIIAGQGTVNEE